MRRTVAVVLSCIVAMPAAAQTPLAQQLLNKVPSLFGGGSTAPRLALPATPDVPGLTRPADRTVAGDPATFDLGGFRLGMSEAAAIANARAKGLRDAGTERHVDFETEVRGLIATRGGAGGPATGRSVLGETTLKDDAGGSFHDDLHASLTRLEHTAERLRHRTILFSLWGVVMVAATAVRIIAEVRCP